jgi:hypothetical protein
MLKNVITKLLNSYLGAFVEDFCEIDYSTWSGEVSLQDVNVCYHNYSVIVFNSFFCIFCCCLV